LSQLYDHVRDFSVYEEVGASEVIGCGALQICWEDLAEIRSLAVHPDFERRRIGTKLMEAVINEARSLNVKKIFTLTYEPDFFRRFDFHVIDRADLPLKIWADCIICVKFPDCDETAMMKDLQ
jgi:amino-acid N-acetyltransferase